MRPSTGLFGLAACVMLAGCVTAPSSFLWAPAHDRAGALLFGEPNSENIGYGIDCAEGQLSFNVWSPYPPKGVRDRTFPTRLRLGASSQTFDLPAEGRVTDMGDGETVTTARLDDPARFLKALTSGRRLTSESYDGRGSAPTPSQTQIARLARDCGIPL